MDVSVIQAWIAENPLLALGGALVLLAAIYAIARGVVARGVIYIAARTRNKYDDILAQKLRPYQAAWLAPFITLYAFAYLAPEYTAGLTASPHSSPNARVRCRLTSASRKASIRPSTGRR